MRRVAQVLGKAVAARAAPAPLAPASRAAMAVAPVRFTPPSTSRPLELAVPPWRCVFAPRASPPRVSAPTRLRSRGIPVRLLPRVFRSRIRANAAPRAFRARGLYPRVAPHPWGNAAFREGDLVRAFAATTGSHRDQGAGAPAHRAARFLPRGSLALCAQDSSRSRLEDAVLARGIPSRPLNGLATRASPRSAQLFSPVPRLPELATDRHSDRPSLSIRRFVVSPLFPATIPPRAISNTPRVSSSRSSRLSRRGRISSTTTTFSSRCVPRGSARPSPDSPQPAPTYPA